VGDLKKRISEKLHSLRKERTDLEQIKSDLSLKLDEPKTIKNLSDLSSVEKPLQKVSQLQYLGEKETPEEKPFHEIRIQVDDLERNKTDLEKSLEQIKDNLAVSQDNEYDIIKDLSKKAKELMDSTVILTNRIKNGVELNKKRFEIEKELAKINKKIERLTKIRAELAEVWE